MHTVTVIAGGILLLALFLLVRRLFGWPAKTVAMAFGAVWFVCAALNMYIGITQAGYTFWQELPIFAVIFGVPAGLAILSTRRFR